MNRLPSEIEDINGALRFLAEDDDFHDDLRLEEVQRALQFWTREVQLSEEDKEELMTHRRVMSVYGKLRALQTACNRAGMRQVPMEHVLHRQSRLHPKVLEDVFGIQTPEPTLASSSAEREVGDGGAGEDLYDWRAYLRFMGTFLLVFVTVVVVAYSIRSSGRAEGEEPSQDF